MVRLPVSGTEVSLRLPAGTEDLLLLESRTIDTALALRLLARTAVLAAGGEVDWSAYPVMDIHVLLLYLRKIVFGDTLLSSVICPASGCGARVDISFRITDYLAHSQPRPTSLAKRASDAGWFELQDAESQVTFRLPSGADQVAVAGKTQKAQDLMRRCICPNELPKRLLRKVERAMEALAPSLAQSLQGVCPDCGQPVNVYFDPQHFVLRELREQAAFIYEDIHLLALHYHWSEEEILALPRVRRNIYAERLRQELIPA